MADWTTDAVDTLENVVAAVRDKTVVPAQKATRAVVFGLLVAFFVLTAVLMLAIALFRVLVVLTGEVWVAYLILGGIFVLAGAFVLDTALTADRGRECLSVHEVVIVGSGPAGLTAAVYAGRANLEADRRSRASAPAGSSCSPPTSRTTPASPTASSAPS